MRWYIPVVIVLLTGCTTVAAVAPVVRAKAEKTNDDAMDAARQLICGNTYRAEIAAVSRWGVDSVFVKFCGRPVRLTR